MKYITIIMVQHICGLHLDTLQLLHTLVIDTLLLSGASSYHKGIDIGAPEGSNIIAITNGKITFADFLGGGGYTITLSVNNMKITFCHVSPNFIVKVGDIVTQGQVIAHVGPKNVYGVLGNTYKDENGNPTNGATTGPHLHLGVRINNNYINPLDLFKTTRNAVIFSTLKIFSYSFR